MGRGRRDGEYDLVVVHEGSGDGEGVEEKASRRKRSK